MKLDISLLYGIILVLLIIITFSLDLRMKKLEMQLDAIKVVLIMKDVFPKEFLKKE